MALLREVVDYLDHLLDTHSITQDQSKNGLQVQGKESVKKVIGGVDACLDLYKKASVGAADLIIVHHGEIWGEGIQSIAGHHFKRFEILLKHSISLYAVHLPLDVHPQLGHNAKIAEALGLLNPQRFARYADVDIGIFGRLSSSIPLPRLVNLINETLQTSADLLDFSSKNVTKIGIVSGAGTAALYECKEQGIECLVTGEIDHTCYHPAKELGISLIAAGHYKTEVPGIVAVLEKVENHFALDCKFVDIPTGL